MNTRTTLSSPLRFLTALGVAALGSLALPAQALDVGVSIGISRPGVHGRIDIGRYPAPVVVQPRPVAIYAPPPTVQPVYMWVPPGHQRRWSRHCAAYGACGVPVYFVQDQWYQQHVLRPYRPAPVYQPAPPPPPRYEPRYEHEPRRYEPEMRRHDERPDGRGAPRYEERRGYEQSHGHGRGRSGHGPE